MRTIWIAAVLAMAGCLGDDELPPAAALVAVPVAPPLQLADADAGAAAEFLPVPFENREIRFCHADSQCDSGLCVWSDGGGSRCSAR